MTPSLTSSCTRCNDDADLRRRIEGSAVQAYTVHHVEESWIGAQGVETRTQQNTRIEPLAITLLEPHHGLGLLAKRRIDHGDLGRIRIGRIRALLQTCQQLFRLGTPA